MASSMAPEAMPSAWAAMPMRPPLSVFMANLNPNPSSPRRFSLGTLTSWNIKVWVSEPRMPNLSSLAPIWKPGMSRSTIRALMPRCPFSGSVWAMTRYVEALLPLVIQFLVPLRR